MPDVLLLSYIYQLMMVRWLRYRCTAMVTTAATKENIALTSVHATHKTSEDNDDQRDSGPFRKWWFASCDHDSPKSTCHHSSQKKITDMVFSLDELISIY